MREKPDGAWPLHTFSTMRRDFTLDTLHFHWERNLSAEAADELLLGYVIPPFQRPSVWTLDQQTRFIESLVLGLPVGVFIYNRASEADHEADLWLIDGQQRLRSVRRFLENEITIFDRRFCDLSVVEQRRFLGTPFPALEMAEDDVRYLMEVYDRLNFGGTPHLDDERALADAEYLPRSPGRP